jgi:dihydrofolate reductase
MIISLIAAMDENRAIGRENRMPWYLPKDLDRFRALTLGHPVIMGRRTFESIGRPLEGRKNIVITGKHSFTAPGCTVVHDLASAFAACEGADEVYIIGGEKLYRDTIAIADRLYLTIVKARVGGDAHFPEIPEDFRPVCRELADDRFPLEFVRYERRRD